MALSTLVEQPSNAYSVRNVRDFIAFVEENHPEELLRISDEISPGSFEATAILANLEQRGLYPMVLFERPVNQLGQVSPFPLLTNIYASRRRCALALGLQAHQHRLDLSLEYSRREARRIPPTKIAREARPGEAGGRDRGGDRPARTAHRPAPPHGPGTLYRHDAGDEGSRQRALQPRLPADHVQGPAASSAFTCRRVTTGKSAGNTRSGACRPRWSSWSAIIRPFI